ncbi:MAG: phenylalanine--tRNA ligase subunit beta [Candidatus Micrarchaeota archaeon]
MVVVEYTYEEMRKLVDLPLEEMIAALSSLGAPSEFEPEVGKIITELTPNRPDWYSMEGLARALRTYYGKGHPQYMVKKSQFKVFVDPSVSKVRPFTVCAVVKGLRLDDDRIRDMVLLQEKLLGTLGRRVKKFGLGLYPLHAIKFPVSYTTMKPEKIRYTPLGSEREMGADEILSDHKKGQQYGHLIKGSPAYPVFVDADGKIMALIPIVNSAETGRIDTGTRDIFIEVSGMEMHACKAALNILVCTFADMGGEVHGVELDYGREKLVTPDLEPAVMPLDIAGMNRILGLSLDEKSVSGLLSKMGYGYRNGSVSVPPYRADVLGEIDIIEDIAIAYGYNNFVPTLPDFFSAGERIGRYDEADAAMRGMGFVETKTFILTNREKLAIIGADKDVVGISNPGSVDFTVIRPNLVLDMIDTFAMNKMRGLPQRFYEIGIVQQGAGSEMRLVFGVMDKAVEFSSFRGCLQTLSRETGLEFELAKEETLAFDKETSCSVISKGRKIGVLGKVDGKVLEKFGIEFDIYICELEI